MNDKQEQPDIEVHVIDLGGIGEDHPLGAVLAGLGDSIQRFIDARADERRRTEAVEDIMAKHLHPEQAKMTWGSTFIGWPWLDNPDFPAAGVKEPVWCRMPTVAEVVRVGVERGDDDVIINEHLKVAYIKYLDRHVLPAICYTSVRSEGRIIPSSAWTSWPIDRSIFDQAKSVDFDPARWPEAVKYHTDIARIAYQAHRDQTKPLIEKAIDEADLRVIL